MSDYQQRIAGSFQERKRLNQLRKRKENLRFWSEFRIIPLWLIVLVIVLFLAAQVIAFVINTKVFAPAARSSRRAEDDVALASLALRNRDWRLARFRNSYFLDRLREPRCETPRDEFRTLDHSGDHPASRVGIHRVRHLSSNARAAALSLRAAVAC